MSVNAALDGVFVQNGLYVLSRVYIHMSMFHILIHILRSNTFFYCTVAIYIPFILFKLEKYK